MSKEIRDFLNLDKHSTADMAEDELRNEVDGWRLCFQMLPTEALEWLARINEMVRFTKRDYKGGLGVLLGFRLEASEFTIGIIEPGYDSIKGVRTLERKTLVIPASGVAYKEFLDDVSDFDAAMCDEELGPQQL